MERVALSAGYEVSVPVVRMKVIEIANALLVEGMEEGQAIRIVITKGEEWAARQPFQA